MDDTLRNQLLEAALWARNNGFECTCEAFMDMACGCGPTEGASAIVEALNDAGFAVAIGGHEAKNANHKAKEALGDVQRLFSQFPSLYGPCKEMSLRDKDGSKRPPPPRRLTWSAGSEKDSQAPVFRGRRAT